MVAGVAGTIEVGGPSRRFLTDLYVDPARQSRGLGSAMLRAAFDGASGADDVLVGRPAGARVVHPQRDAPVVAAAVPRSGRRTARIAGCRRRGARRPTSPRPRRSSTAWTGLDRTVDFAFYASLPDAAGFVIEIDGRPAAIGWARRELAAPGRWLDHATIAPDADPVRAVFGVLRAAANGERLGAAVPGPNPAVAALLEGGVRIGGTDTFCATDRDQLDPVRILPSPGLL